MGGHCDILFAPSILLLLIVLLALRTRNFKSFEDAALGLQWRFGGLCLSVRRLGPECTKARV